MDNKNSSAFPFSESNNPDVSVSAGLSKREIMAGLALQGILANHWCQNDFKNNIVAMGYQETAQQAIGYADALLNELSKP